MYHVLLECSDPYKLLLTTQEVATPRRESPESTCSLYRPPSFFAGITVGGDFAPVCVSPNAPAGRNSLETEVKIMPVEQWPGID